MPITKLDSDDLIIISNIVLISDVVPIITFSKIENVYIFV